MNQELAVARGRDLAPEMDGGEDRRPVVTFRPTTDIYENEDHVVLVVDMPGVAPEDVDVTLERQILTIRGKGHAVRPEGYRRIYAEYGEGDFERVFTLSDEIDREGIEADHRNGVLTLTLPKAESARTRRIEVKAA